MCPSFVKTIFSGLKSLCDNPSEWIYYKINTISATKNLIIFVVKELKWFFKRLDNYSPSAYDIMKYNFSFYFTAKQQWNYGIPGWLKWHYNFSIYA